MCAFLLKYQMFPTDDWAAVLFRKIRKTSFMIISLLVKNHISASWDRWPHASVVIKDAAQDVVEEHRSAVCI